MSFLGIDFNLESSSRLTKISTMLKFYFKLALRGFISPIKLPKKSILIYEIGYDKQGESSLFQGLFGRIDALICTNIAWEHSGGFDGFNLDVATYNELKPYLNRGLVEEMDNQKHRTRTINSPPSKA